MSVGFAMLAHRDLGRAAEVARHLALQGAPVVIHVDKRTPDEDVRGLADDVAATPMVTLAPRVASEWGTWGLTEATCVAVRTLLERAPNIGHVFLISGSCLPLRPLADLQRFLADHRDTDFIESVAIEDVSWAVDGLEEERFTLSFPFSWKRHRGLFDRWVAVQRLFRRKRRPPPGVVPRMGSQWWCLTATTLRSILADPELPRVTRFFQRVWIPDESFFQTMARRHARDLNGRSLTLARFGFRGRPHLFYDDHLPLLLSSDAFFARKIWPGARELYGHFLGPAAGRVAADPVRRVDQSLLRSVDRRARGRAGLVTPGRCPAQWADTLPTAEPYRVLHGLDHLYRDARSYLSDHFEGRVHGRLFARDEAEFADGGQDTVGGLTRSAPLRDYDQKGFLRNLVWASRGETQAFFTGPEDADGMPDVLVRDPNARVTIISGAWLLSLDDCDAMAFRQQAARLQKAELKALDLYRQWWARAHVEVWSLADAIDDPRAPLSSVLGTASFTAMPALADLTPIRRRLGLLRDAGLTPIVAGDLDAVLDIKAAARERRRLS